MEKLIENEKLLTEFAKAIYRDIEKYINEYEKSIENERKQNSQ